MDTNYDAIYIDYAQLSELPGSFDLFDLLELLVNLRQKSGPLIVMSFPPIEQQDDEKMCQINSLFYLTDIFYFDLKEAVQTFQAHYDTFTADKTKKKINAKGAFDYFIKGIATATMPTVEGHKIGIFIDDFNKLTIVEAQGTSASTSPYDCRVYPKLNPHNTKVADEYKKTIQDNKKYLMNLFLGGYLNGSNSKKTAFAPENIYVSYLTGLELVKKAVECLNNKLPIPTSASFWAVKISKDKIAEELQKNAMKSMESGLP